MQNIKVSRFRSCRVETDGRTDTTDRITFLANAVGKYILPKQKITRYLVERAINPGVDGLERSRLTPRLFDRFVDASRCFRRRPRDSFFDGDCDAANAWLIILPISLKHDGNTSRLGLFDCSLWGQTFLQVDNAKRNNCKLNCCSL